MTQPTRPAEPNGLGPFAVAALMIAAFLATYTFSSLNVALPDIGSALGADAGRLKLVLGAYATAFAAFLILGGRLGDRHGRHRLFAVGLVGFAAASAAAGFAPDAWTLIAIRAVQGVAAACVVPQILAIIQASTTGARQLATIGLFAACSGLGTGAGQLVGGVLLRAFGDEGGWRAIFWFAAALSLLALVAATRLPSSRSPRPEAHDHPGLALLSLMIVCLLVPLALGPGSGWPAWTVVALVLAPIFAALLWRWGRALERRGRAPLVPPRVVGESAVSTGLLISFVFFGGFGAFMFEFALISQGTSADGGWQVSPLHSGVTLVPFCIAFAIASVTLGPVRARLGGVGVMMVGVLGQAAALVALAALVAATRGEPDQLLLQPLLLVVGVAQAWVFGPVVSVVMQGVPRDVAGLTGGLLATTQQAALALGVAVYGALLVALQHVGFSLSGAFAGCLLVQAASAGVVLALLARLRRTVRADPHLTMRT